jgi:hypothetical protein
VDFIAYKARALYHTDGAATIYLKLPDVQLTGLAAQCRDSLHYKSGIADRELACRLDHKGYTLLHSGQ